MADIAELGIAVDSSQVTTASKELTMMAASASKAEDATSDLGDSSKELTTSLAQQVAKGQETNRVYGNMYPLMRQLIDSNSQLNRAMDATNRTWTAANDNMESAKKSVISSTTEFIKLALVIRDAALALGVAKALYEAWAGSGSKVSAVMKALWFSFEVGHPVLAFTLHLIKENMGAIAAFALRVTAPFVAVIALFELFKAAVSAASEKTEEYNKLLADSSSSGLGLEYYQKLAKAIEKTGVSAETATEALKKFREVSEPKLNGSELLKELEKSVKAGNFEGNTGVKAFQDAKSAEDRLKAMSFLITQAMRDGERLAALDLAEKFLPPEMLDRLRAIPDYLEQIALGAEKISREDIVSTQQIASLVEVEQRLTKVKERWEKLMEPFPDLIGLGIILKKTWVSILEDILSALEKVANAFSAVADKFSSIITTIASYQVPGWLSKLMMFTNIPLYVASKVMTAGVAPTDLPSGLDKAADIKPGDLLKNPSSQTLMMLRETQERLADRSKRTDTTDTGKTVGEFDRLEKAIARQTAAMEADVKAIGKGVAEQARLRTEARLTEAAIQEFGEVNGETAAKIEKLSKRVAEATQKVAEMKLKSDISFGRQTALFTEEDVQIATRLRDLYGDDVPRAMASTYAQALRINNVIKSTADAISSNLSTALSDWVNGTKTAKAAFQDMSRAIVKALIDIIIKQYVVASLMRVIGMSFGGGGGLGGLFGLGTGQFATAADAGLGGAGAIGSGGFNFIDAQAANGMAFKYGNVIPFARGGVVGGPTLFNMGLMGEAGPEAVMPLKRGRDGKLGISGSGGLNVQINNYASKDIDIKTRKEEGPDGTFLMVDMVKRAYANGEFDGGNSGLYGVRRRKVR